MAIMTNFMSRELDGHPLAMQQRIGVVCRVNARMRMLDYKGDSCEVMLWWCGEMVPLHAGQRVTYFELPNTSWMIESVDTPPPTLLRVGPTTFVKVS